MVTQSVQTLSLSSPLQRPKSTISPSSKHYLHSHMTTAHDSFSAAESIMEDTTATTTGITNNNKQDQDEEVDAEVWATFNNSFRQVQSVLDRNRVLIQQVNDNHQSRMPDNMAKNVALIQELNGNISKVVGLYSDLNSNFSSACHDRNKGHNGKSNGKA